MKNRRRASDLLSKKGNQLNLSEEQHSAIKNIVIEFASTVQHDCKTARQLARKMLPDVDFGPELHRQFSGVGTVRQQVQCLVTMVTRMIARGEIFQGRYGIDAAIPTQEHASV